MIKVHIIVDFVISLILWILISVLIVPLVFLLFLYKTCVVFVARRVDKHLHPTQPNDTYFSMGDTKQVPIVNVAQIWRVDGILDIDEFRTLFQQLFITCPESRSNYLNLYCYLKRFGGYVFKKSVDHLEIDKHIVVRDLASSGESTLEGFIVKWMVREKYVEERPLWEIALVYLPVLDDDDEEDDDDGDGKDEGKKKIDNYEKNEDDDDNLGTIISKINNNEKGKKNNSKINSNKFETVVLLKMHHCLTDGYGFIHIVDKLTGNEAPYLVEEEEESLFQKVNKLK